MPTILRFFLEGPRPPSPYRHAKGLYRIVLDWVAAASPETATQIHDADQLKPYTISPLWNASPPGGGCWFEVSVLPDGLIEAFLSGLSRSPADIELGPQRFRIAGWEVRAAAGWNDLLAPLPKRRDAFPFDVRTPTACRAGGEFRKNIVVPDPVLYFGSWLERWNLCAEWEWKMSPAILEIVRERIAVEAFSGGTQKADLGHKQAFIGFTGDVRCALLKHKDIPDISLEEQTLLAALARFATFCGTGRETMRGMGQTVYRGN